MPCKTALWCVALIELTCNPISAEYLSRHDEKSPLQGVVRSGLGARLDPFALRSTIALLPHPLSGPALQ